jgi:hypothetical protein
MNGVWLKSARAAEKAEGKSRFKAMDAIEESIFVLLADVPAPQRKASLELMQAALAVALHGEDAVPKQLLDRAASWHKGRKRRSDQGAAEMRTRHAVRHAKGPKVRDLSEPERKTAFEVAAETQGISRITAEKRVYRKRRS